MSGTARPPAAGASDEAVGKPPAVNRSPRHRAREFVVQGLYEWRLGGQEGTAIEAHLAELEGFARADRNLFESLLRGARSHADTLFAALAPYLDRKVEEVSPIEASILLLGSYELCHQPQTPYRVIINEAIELAKTYGGTDGHKYVNGVLDKLALLVRADEVAAGRTRRSQT